MKTTLPQLFFVSFFLDILSVALVVPLLPTFLTIFGIPMSYMGYVQSIYGICQVLTTSVWGKVSDVTGRRFVMVISVLGTALSFSLMALSVHMQSFSLFLFGRVVIGLTRQSMTVASAYVTDLTAGDSTERACLMGRVTASAYLGFVFGPAIGGYLTETFGAFFCVVLASGFNFVNVAVMYQAMPRAPSQRQKQQDAKIKSQPTHLLFFAIELMRNPYTILLVLVLACASAAGILNQSSYTTMLQDRFAFSVTHSGLLLSLSAGLNVLVLMYAMPFLLARVNNDKLAQGAALCTFVGYVVQFLAPTPSFVVIGVILCSSTSALVDTFLKTQFSMVCPPGRTGEAMGFIYSLEGANRVVCPIFSSMLLGYSSRGPLGVGAMLSFLGAVLIYFFIAEPRFRTKGCARPLTSQ